MCVQVDEWHPSEGEPDIQKQTYKHVCPHVCPHACICTLGSKWTIGKVRTFKIMHFVCMFTILQQERGGGEGIEKFSLTCCKKIATRVHMSKYTPLLLNSPRVWLNRNLKF
ncbi:hypothetical protein POVWA2_005380 [Plasmodium ovale wallikeri]|uniref:Uncharacterized protein n=1 Tax=Plasmodium ovale wallikeri TaxID=864142 RepID=A0A1A8YHP1_PLAOA|nr:hypothetical protein POVWA1_005290 [Plasmodium ovale wallikeri]SBT31681.1 hypothetical protein POVWA2_005380 [Plasmodium ovale wallikeri]